MCRANGGITDSAVLDEALDRADGDLEAVGKIFHDLRFEDVRALQNMQMVTLRSALNGGSRLFCALDSGLQEVYGAVLQKLAGIRWMGAAIRDRISKEVLPGARSQQYRILSLERTLHSEARNAETEARCHRVLKCVAFGIFRFR